MMNPLDICCGQVFGLSYSSNNICIIDHCSSVIFLQLINFSNCVSASSDSPPSSSLVASSLRSIRFCTWLTHSSYSIKIVHKVPLHYAESTFFHLHQTEMLNTSYAILSNQATLNVHSSMDPYYQKHPHQWHYTLHYFCELQTKSYILDVIGRFYSFSFHHKCCLSTICRFHS